MKAAIAALAQQVGRRVVDPRCRDEALRRLLSSTLKPSTNCWRPCGISLGGAGLAIMCATFDAHFPDAGWDVYGHDLLAAGLPEVRSPDLQLSLFSGSIGYAAAVWLSSCGGKRYPSLIGALDAALLPRMRAFVEQLASAEDADGNAYDVVNGISGWVGYLLGRAGSLAVDQLAREVADALTVPLSAPGLGRMGYRSASGGLVVDTGLAHGVAGPLAALSLLQTRYQFANNDVMASIRWGAQWLVDSAVWLSGCLLWPATVASRADLRPAHYEHPANAGSWCHGSSGVARAVYLAGSAAESVEIRDFAVDAMRSHCNHPPALLSPNLCHGLAGQLLLTRAFAHDTSDPLFMRTADSLTGQLLDCHRPDSLLGFLDVEQFGLTVDNPGLLRGAAGEALSLMATTEDVTPNWAQLLLII